MARPREKAFAGDPKPALTRFPVLAAIALGDRPRRDCGNGEREMRICNTSACCGFWRPWRLPQASPVFLGSRNGLKFR